MSNYRDGLYLLNWSAIFDEHLVERGSIIRVKNGKAQVKINGRVRSANAEKLELILTEPV